MAKLWKRIKGRIAMTVSGFRNDCRFSLKLAIYRMMDDLCWRFGPRKVAEIFHKKKDQWIMAFLERELQYVVDTYKDDNNLGMPHENAPIWVCWWTGEETAPALVKQCIRSIRKNANGHPVHLITKDNYAQYLNIPDYILSKVESGSMCIANFTDYLRFSLLAQYGGWWLDATIYCPRPLPEDIFKMSVFSCKGRTGPGDFYSEYRWTAFCFAGHRGNVTFRFLQAAFDAYWKENPVSIDYLLVDYLICLAYRKNPTAHRLLEELPENNLHRDDLQAAMNAALPRDQWDKVIQPDTVLYKLSWRETYPEQTPEGTRTVYGYFLDM